MIFCCWIICFFVASSLVGVIQAVLFFFLRTHSCNESESVVSCVCVCVNLLLSDVCDKCNDFVFHYLLDYSCRVFVFSCFFLVDSALLSAHSQKTVDFNRNVYVGVENSFALVPCFPRRFQRTLQSSSFEFNSSKLFGVVSFCLCSFLPHFCFGFRTTAECFPISRGQSAFPCFYLL